MLFSVNEEMNNLFDNDSSVNFELKIIVITVVQSFQRKIKDTNFLNE